MKRRIAIASFIASIAIATISFPLETQTRAADKPPALGPSAFDRSSIPVEAEPTDPKAAKIVLISGPREDHNPGEHEGFAGCALLMHMLQQTPGVAPVIVENSWPSKPETLKNARSIVFYMNGGGKQSTIAHADEIQKMMDAGVGIVHIHQVIDYPTEPGKQAMKWLGGVYDAKAGGARGHWDETFDHFPEHEITRGVEPFTLNDGWILKLTFVPELKGITPLLRTTQLSPKGKPTEPITGTQNIVCWAYDRPDGGRAFVLTGGHGHKNWGLPGLRRLVVNGILWTAKVDIPKGGAPVELNQDDLMKDLDVKTPKAPATVKK
jgi:type 1 glutamine amidotransferase